MATNTQKITILESKLKRHKISYSNENGKIIIGKAKADYTTLIGLVILPIFASIAFSLLLVWNKTLLANFDKQKIIAIGIFPLLAGLFMLSRVMKKKMANKNLKFLETNAIRIKNNLGEHIFNADNIKDFEYSVDQIQETIYEGNLFIIDDKNRKHQLLAFDDENPKYVLDDLKWFAEYFSIYTNIESDNSKIEGAITLSFSSTLPKGDSKKGLRDSEF